MEINYPTRINRKNWMNRLIRLITTLALSGLMAACGTDSSPGGSSVTTSAPAPTEGVTVSGVSSDKPAFSLRVTDAPLDDVVAVVMRFTAVRVRNVDGDWSSYVFETPREIDLLKLQGAATEDLLIDMPLDKGDYDEIRLFVDEAPMSNYVDLGVGGLVEMEVKDGSKKGLQVKGDFSVTRSRQASLVIDFDLRKSLKYSKDKASSTSKKSKKSKGYTFKSKLRLVSYRGSGHIRGLVDPALLSSSAECSDNDVDSFNAVYVYAGHDAKLEDIDESKKKPRGPLTTTTVKYDSDSGTYRYEAGFLPEGEYTVAITCNADLDDPEEGRDNLRFFGVHNATVKVKDIEFL
jgi:hypothetical protein